MKDDLLKTEFTKVVSSTSEVNIGTSYVIGDPLYNFIGDISEEILHRYLDRAIGMTNTLFTYNFDTYLDPPINSTSQYVKLGISGTNLTDGIGPYYINLRTAYGKAFYIDHFLLNDGHLNKSYIIPAQMAMLANIQAKIVGCSMFECKSSA